jgi:hypothetical protein
MRKVLRTKDKNGNLILIDTAPVLFSQDKCSSATRQGKRHLVRQGATIFKKETIRLKATIRSAGVRPPQGGYRDDITTHNVAEYLGSR